MFQTASAMPSTAIERDLELPMRGGVHLFANLCGGWTAFGIV